MNKTNSIGQAEKTESLRNSLIMAGYDMAASQAKDMSEDEDYWSSYMIDGKINPKCIDISEQASHSFYNNELDIWFEPDEEVFPEGCGEWGLNELIENNSISDEEVFDLLYKGADNYIIENYGADWKEKNPDPKYN